MTSESTNLQKKFRGPLAVSKIYPGDTYGVADLNFDSVGHRYAVTTHATELQLWKPTQFEIESDCDGEKDSEKSESEISLHAPPSVGGRLISDCQGHVLNKRLREASEL